jgi:hypothetical protein
MSPLKVDDVSVDAQWMRPIGARRVLGGRLRLRSEERSLHVEYRCFSLGLWAQSPLEIRIAVDESIEDSGRPGGRRVVKRTDDRARGCGRHATQARLPPERRGVHGKRLHGAAHRRMLGELIAGNGHLWIKGDPAGQFSVGPARSKGLTYRLPFTQCALHRVRSRAEWSRIHRLYAFDALVNGAPAARLPQQYGLATIEATSIRH